MFGEYERATELERENLLLREMLWRNHGHDQTSTTNGLYCCECPMDFKRVDVDTLERKLFSNSLHAFMESQNT